MEFLRFGSSIPGSYWGCCACCIIQNFKMDPDTKSSIQIVNGDGGTPMMKNGGFIYAGPTYREIFHQRIRIGTFDTRDMPNHAFLAILTRDQLAGSIGKKWLAILKEAGFEFIRTVSNSVYEGQSLLGNREPSDGSPNYIFGLFRNIGSGSIKDQFTPPKEWTDLPSVKPEFWDSAMAPYIELTDAQRKADVDIWNKIGPAKLLSEEEIVEAGAPVIYGGWRYEAAKQQPKEVRERLLAAQQPKSEASITTPMKTAVAQPLQMAAGNMLPSYEEEDECDECGPDCCC